MSLVSDELPQIKLLTLLVFVDGMGRKVGDLIQYTTQMIAAFIVAFYLEWRLAIVLLSAFPLIAAAGSFMITAITAAQVCTDSMHSCSSNLIVFSFDNAPFPLLSESSP